MSRELHTPRLRIRDWSLDDLGPLAEIFAKQEVWRFPFGRGFSTEETAAYLERKLEAQSAGIVGPSAVEERSSGRIIGYIALSPPEWLPEVMPAVEIGWRLDPSVWRQGFATEGARGMLEYGFREMGLREILGIYEPDNAPSGQVMKRLGMPFDRQVLHPWFGRVLHIHRLSRWRWELARSQKDQS